MSSNIVKQRIDFLRTLIEDAGLGSYGFTDEELGRLVGPPTVEPATLELLIRLKDLSGNRGHR
jgi:hypothetical protein